MNGDQRMMGNNAFPNVSIKKSQFIRNNNSLSFPLVPFFVENYMTKLFLVKFEKEQPFLFIPAIFFRIFLFCLFLLFPEWSPVRPVIFT